MTANDNATLKTTTLTVRGKDYSLYLDFAALATAEARLRKVGIQANLLQILTLTDLTASGVAAMLFAALLRDLPEVTYDYALALISLPRLTEVFTALMAAYTAAQADPDEDQAGASPNDSRGRPTTLCGSPYGPQDATISPSRRLSYGPAPRVNSMLWSATTRTASSTTS